MDELNKGFIDDFTFQMKLHYQEAVDKKILEPPNTISEIIDAGLAAATQFALGWVEAAAQFHNNEQYYRGLLDQIGKAIGKKAYICDDGSVSSSVLRAKLPQLVRQLVRVADGSEH